MTDHDDDPTPVRRVSGQIDPLEGGSGIRMRLHSPAHAFPVVSDSGAPIAVVLDQPRRQRSRSDTDEPDPLDARIDARLHAMFSRKMRKFWGWLGASAGTTIVALVAAGRSWIGGDVKPAVDPQAIERAAAERARTDAERQIDTIRAAFYRELDSIRAAFRGKRDEQPDPPISGASKRIQQ